MDPTVSTAPVASETKRHERIIRVARTSAVVAGTVYVIVVGFVLTVWAVTNVAVTQYIPAAEQNPFAAGAILAALAVGGAWFVSRRRR